MKQNRDILRMKISKWKREKEYLIPYLENRYRNLEVLRSNISDKAFSFKNQVKYNKRQLKKFQKQVWDIIALMCDIDTAIYQLKYDISNYKTIRRILWK